MKKFYLVYYIVNNNNNNINQAFFDFGIALVIENIALTCLMNELSRAKEVIVKINEQYSINKKH